MGYALTAFTGSSPRSTDAPMRSVRPRDGEADAAERPAGALAGPTWFGPVERPLFGWWHLPSTRSARATVVMAPAMARERLAADYSWRLLAARLADRGFAVLRFDFSATGDSAGSATDPDLVHAWQHDVAAALESASTASEAPVVLLGHRLGATLALAATRRTDTRVHAPLHAMVLWDPVVRGKRYLRELHAQQLLAVPGGVTDPGSGWADVPGDDLRAATAAAIGRLNLLGTGALPAGSALVLARPGAEAALLPLVDGLPNGLVEGVDGQPELLNLDPIVAQHAYRTVDRIAGWMDGVVDGRTHPVHPPAVGTTRLMVERRAAGLQPAARHEPDLRQIEERAGFRSGAGIFTVESSPALGPVGRTVLLLSAGVEAHTGPGRLWVDLARQWAAHGMRVVRCDLPGLGESPSRAGSEPQSVYEAAAIDEVETLIRELDPQDPGSVILLGMCSGAYNALEAGARLGTRRLIALAFGWWLVPAEFRRGQRLDRRRRLYRSGLAGLGPLMALPSGRRMLVEHSERLWLVGSSAGLAAPLRPFRKAVAAGTDVTMVMGPSDVRHFAPQRRRLRRLCARPGFALHAIAGLDHGLLSGDPRRVARDRIFDQLVAPEPVTPDESATER